MGLAVYPGVLQENLDPSFILLFLPPVQLPGQSGLPLWGNAGSWDT